MIDAPLYEAMAKGLGSAEDEFIKLGVTGWNVAMVAYDPNNPKAYLVIGTAGDEAFQQRIAGLINPDDSAKPPTFVAKKADDIKVESEEVSNRSDIETS